MSIIDKNSENSEQGIIVELPLFFKVQQCEFDDTALDFNKENQLAFEMAELFSLSPSDTLSERAGQRHTERNIQNELAQQNRVLDKKLNIVMQLLNTILVSMNGGEQSQYLLSLSANTIEWDYSQFAIPLNSQNNNSPNNNYQNNSFRSGTLQTNQNLIFEFFPSNELPYPIKRSGVVTEINESIVKAKFDPLNGQNQEHFEKWIFQLHRRSLQSKVETIR